MGSYTETNVTTELQEILKYGNKCFECANIQIDSSSDSWYQSPGLVVISRAPRDPVTLAIIMFFLFGN